MPRPRMIPCALAVGGSDSGGGAGIQADLKTFAAHGVHGVSVITCVTAQNPRGVHAVQAVRPVLVEQQLEAVFTVLRPAAAKTGMLFSTAIIERVAAWFASKRSLPLVVDPVMVATSGAMLLKPSALRVLQRKLLPRAALITPNVNEVEALLGWRPRDPEAMRHAARQLHERLGAAVLIKGGHLPASAEAADLFFDGHTELLLTARRTRGIHTHGTGCTYAAAITAELALGHKLTEAVIRAKTYITGAIAHSQRVGRTTVLNHFWSGTSRQAR